MCTLVIVRSAEAPLTLAANRDEMLDRPWSPPAAAAGAVYPRDDRAGGTWIGVGVGGVVGVITNRLIVPAIPGRRSRGELCRGALTAGSVEAARSFVRQAVGREAYNGFNLFIADRAEAWMLSYGEGRLEERAVAEGVSTITSRHELNHAGLADVRSTIAAARDLEAELAAVMRDHGAHGDDGYFICKHGDVYGTRSSSIIVLPQSGPARFLFAPGKPCEHAFAPVAVP